MKGGRSPALTARGRLVLAAAALLSLTGAMASVWALIALGMALAALLGASYLAFFPSAVLIWRRHVELVWSLPGERGEHGSSEGLVAGRTFALEVTLRNRGPVRLGRATVTVIASSAIDPPGPPGLPRAPDSDENHPIEMDVGARSETTVVGEGRVRAAGFWYLHGAVVRVGDPLGIASLEAYFPSPLALKVLPRVAVRATPPPLRAAGASDERAGLHALRLRGLGGELRELRDHAPGDPFKQIAWKATARTGRLMVRDLDRETLVTHYLLVDAGSTMRDGTVGKCGIDQAVELAAAYARAALETGDRVGLCTFDGRLLAHLTPADGPVQRMRIIERLMEALHAVDEDATDLTDGELVAIVARYLRHQDSADVRLRVAPAIDDPAWSHVATGPRGELYDLKQLDRAVARTVDGGRGVRGARVAASQVEASDPAMARLRLFCRLRGIELPHRRSPEAGRRARGLAAALEVAARGRGTERIVIFSDLEGLEGTLAPVARCVALARRRGHRLVCLAPTTGVIDDGSDAAATEILGWERRRAARASRRRVEALGVTVLGLGPADSLADVFSRMGGRRRVRA